MTNAASSLAVITLLFLAGGTHAARITVSGRQILEDGNPYIIRGVCYNPVPSGSSSRNFGTLTQDLALMQEAHINTIRVYSPIASIAVLDEIAAAGLKVIMGFGYNQGGNNDILSGSYLTYVNTYKNHEAVLLWELGNEYNYHPEWFSNDVANWYAALNNAATAIHAADPDHPVSTAHGELPNAAALSSCPGVDIWGMNVYRWDNPAGIYSSWRTISAKPMYLSEAGADSYMNSAKNGYAAGSNEPMQADAVRAILNVVFSNADAGSGVTLFAFVDEWWKAGNPGVQDAGGFANGGAPYDNFANEEYWGMVKIDRTKKPAFDEVKSKYGSVAAITARSGTRENEITIHPNPAGREIRLSGLTAINREIAIYDIAGRQKIRINRACQNTVVQGIAGLAKGLYIVKISRGKNTETRRFVKY